VVDRDVEEALDLLAVQIHRQDAIGSGGDEQVGDQLGGDGNARLILAILTRIAVERDHGRDAVGGGTTGCIDHDEQLHQVVIRRRAGRLDQINIRAADVLVDLHKRFPIREAGDCRLPERDAHGATHGLGKRTI